MNQISFFSTTTRMRLVLGALPIRFRLAEYHVVFSVALVFVSLFVPVQALAQNSFQPMGTSPQNGQWAPPNFQQDDVAQASNNAIDSSANPPSFPANTIAFDQGIRAANLNVPSASDQFTSDATMESTLDSTATLLSNLKHATSEQISGIVGNFQQSEGWTGKLKSLTGSADISKMMGSLALVLGVYFAFVWVMRKIYPESNKGLPAEVIEVMGQVPFGPKRNLQLVRLGSKLLLLMNGPEGTHPIGEITDSQEVEYLASLCPGKRKTGRGNSNATAAFQRGASNRVDSNPADAPGPTLNHSNLANILRTLEQATQKPHNAVYEA